MSAPVILLVEDNPKDAVLTQRALRKANVLNEVVIARNGEEALDFLFGTGRDIGRETSGAPLVVFLDLKLPGMHGIEVLRRIRQDQRTKLIPVIVLTTSVNEEDVLQCYESGANSYIRKPVDFDKFVEAMSTIGVYWTVLNQPPPEHKGASDGDTDSRSGC